MSLGMQIMLPRALDLARRLSADLAPACVRSKVVGSVRRKRPTVGDIEILVEPTGHADLLGHCEPDVDRIRHIAESWGTITKGGQKMIQIADALGVAGLAVELWIVTPPAEWGPLLAIRTGPARLSQVAATRLHNARLRCEHGRIIEMDTDDVVPCPDEETFFRLAGLACLPPARRDAATALLAVEINAAQMKYV